jgi:hypothetical protein
MVERVRGVVKDEDTADVAMLDETDADVCIPLKGARLPAD